MVVQSTGNLTTGFGDGPGGVNSNAYGILAQSIGGGGGNGGFSGSVGAGVVAGIAVGVGGTGGAGGSAGKVYGHEHWQYTNVI